MGITATLGDFPLLGSSDVRWPLREGVRYSESQFVMRPQDADKLLQGPLSPVVLRISDGGRTVTIKFLYVIARAPAENRWLANVMVVDRRWFWGHAHVERSFNVRRNIGVKRQKAPDTPPELEAVTDVVRYAPWSLDGEVPWTAQKALENVLAKLVRPESDLTGNTPGWTIDPSIGNQLDNLPIEDLELSDKGDAALGRLLAYLPEAAVTVDTEGQIQVYSRATGLEGQAIANAGPESVGAGHVELISNARLRPSKIHVLFTREHEVRFDFTESDSPTVTEDQRFMDNVLDVPDFTLELNDGSEVVQGTWIRFDQAFNAWGAPPNQGNLSNATNWYIAVRRNMVPYMDLWTGILNNGALDPNADWMGRIGAIQKNFRRTFRINRRWMDRIRELKAHKVATLDPTTGQRAPALAYANHARIGSMRSIRININQGEPEVFAMNVQSYPTSGGDPARLDSTAKAAPADVSIADHDQGVFQLNFLPDIYRVHEMLLPSPIETNGSGTGANGLPVVAGPTLDIEDTEQPIAFNALDDAAHDVPQLTAAHKVAMIVTAVPGGTNSQDADHLFRVTREPRDVLEFLPPGFRAGVADSRGPEMELRIGPTLETARVAWVDDRATDIDASFGVGVGAVKIDDLVVNLSNDASGAGSLDALATAIAAKTWAMLADRWQGSKTVRLSPGTQPVGHIEEVSHEVAAETGETQTVIELPGQLRQFDIFSLLPESTRRIVLRLAPSPGKGAG